MAARVQSKITKTEAERRKSLALARLRELELAERSGKLLDRATVERTWFEKGQQVRDGILNIPDRLAPLLASISDSHTVHQLLDTELRKALNEISESISTVN